MALSMALPLEFNDVVEYFDLADQEYFSDLTSTDGDEEFLSAPRAFEQVVPRCLKRTYGVLVGNVVPERRLRSRVDEQLELLRAIIPNSCSDEKASILKDTYDYIEKLQRQVKELHREAESEAEADFCSDLSLPSSTGRLIADVTSHSEASYPSQCACPQPIVEVTQNTEGMKIRIECEKRPGLLVAIMKLLETSGLNVDEASIACADHLIFDGIGTEVDRTSFQNCSDSLSLTSAEDVRANLVSLIADDRLVI